MYRAVVNSLPKSGTNLVKRFMTLSGMRFVRHLPARHSLVARLAAGMQPSYPIGVDFIQLRSKTFVDKSLASLDESEFLTLHAGHSPALLDVARAHHVKPVLVLRDPRAVLNAFVHYVPTVRHHPMRRHFETLGLEQRYAFALAGGWAGKVYLEPLDNCCRAMETWKASPDVLTVRFEDLVGEKGGGSADRQEDVCSTLAAYLGIPDASRDHAIENLFGASLTFRSGQIASWREEMPAHLQERATGTLASILAQWGYDA